MVSLRGATTIREDQEGELLEAVTELLQHMIGDNSLVIEHINAIFFSCTKDIVSAYPARAARAMGITKASLMCLQEMHVENSLEKCIRVCIFYNESLENEIKHVYLRDAAGLRPDLMK